MELAHSLLLNEEALSKIPDNKKPVFVFEWLRFLDKVLSAAQKVNHTDITSIISALIHENICSTPYTDNWKSVFYFNSSA